MVNKKKKTVFKVRYIVILVLGFYIISTFISQQRLIRKLNEEKIKKEQEIESLKHQVAEIEQKIKHTDSLEYIEKIAREELKMIKPYEIIFIDKEKDKDRFKENTSH